MQNRRLAIILILSLAGALALVLFASMRPSTLFRIAAPQPQISTSVKDLAHSVSPSTLENVSATTLLEKPRYTGQDIQGRNWTLTADNAGQEGSTTSGTYVLNRVEAVWTDPSQTTPLVVTAQKGRYAQVSSTVLLSGEVSASGLGYDLTAPEVRADLNTRHLKASGGTRITGNTGGPKGWNVDIAAPNLDADQDASELTLTGGVKARFTPTKGN
jgi:hypothetical protein